MRALGLILCLGLLAPSAHAHLMSPGHGTLNLVEGKAYIVVALPIAVFSQGPAAGIVSDGVLTRAELKANEATLKAAVRSGLRVEAGAKRVPFSSILLNLPEGADHTPGRGTELVMMIVAPVGAEAKTITLTALLWAKGAETLKMRATVTEGHRTTRTEVADLTPKAPRHRFFATPAR